MNQVTAFFENFVKRKNPTKLKFQQDPEGFPGLDEIYDNTSSTGRYLRQYQTVENECEIVEEDIPQVPWHDYHQGLDNTWRVILADNKLTNYKPGQIIGVKSKCCGNGHNAYWFCGGQLEQYIVYLPVIILGDDIVFERIIWAQHSRGVLRCGISNIRFTDIKILREGPQWCLATSGGGPQVP